MKHKYKNDPQRNYQLKITGFKPLSCLIRIYIFTKRKKAKISNPYNQIPRLTQDTIWERGKDTRNHHTQENQKASPFPAGDHKAARNIQDSVTKTNAKHKQQNWIHQRSIALEPSVRNLLEDLNILGSINRTPTPNVDQDSQMPNPHESAPTYRFLTPSS